MERLRSTSEELATPIGGTASDCPTCGALMPEGFRFCGQCGRALANAFHPATEGTLTFLFTDMVGSTVLTRALGVDKARDLFRAHHELIRREIQSFGGFEVKTLGDGFMVVFVSAAKAVQCAIGIQKGLVAYNQEHLEAPLSVRIGMNSGDALREGEDFFGLAVSLAARIAKRAAGGQILVSERVKEAAGLAPGYDYVLKGRFQLSGFPRRRPLYEVVWRGDE